MNWIRASERLPDEFKEVYLKFKGFKYVGHYKSKFETFRSDGHQLFTKDDFSDVFWSDD